MTTTPEHGSPSDRPSGQSGEHPTTPLPPVAPTQPATPVAGPVADAEQAPTAPLPPAATEPASTAPLPPADTEPASPAATAEPPRAEPAAPAATPPGHPLPGQPVLVPSAPPAPGLAASTAGAGGGHPGGPHDPFAVPTPAAGAEPATRRQRIWLPVTSAAAGAALVAALATAGLTHALADGDDDASGGRPASLATLGTTSNDTVPVSGSTSQDPDWQAVAHAVQASVVAIQATTSSGGVQGSGVVVDDKGHIVTNNHVVADAQGDVQVTLVDGRMLDATVAGTDPTTDLAVITLKDPPSDLHPAVLGDSSKVSVGQPVMAVGNPLGLANTVTTGIVSAVDRPVTTSESGSPDDATVTNAIQIDAAVNPGNSGGPLFDAEGKVIGINSSIMTTSSSSGSIGLGFAIPVNLVENIATQLIDKGTAEHAFLGVGLVDGTASADGVTRRGAQVQSVSDDSPASKAGLQVGDTIVAIDGKVVGGSDSLTAYVRSMASGDDVTLTVVRDGKAIDVDVTLATRVENPPADQGSQGGQQGPGDLPGGLTPDDLWRWFEQQQGR